MIFECHDSKRKSDSGGYGIEDARKYAEGLLTAAKNNHDDWNYGNAIQDGNFVLGRIALKEGRTAVWDFNDEMTLQTGVLGRNSQICVNNGMITAKIIKSNCARGSARDLA